MKATEISERLKVIESEIDSINLSVKQIGNKKHSKTAKMLLHRKIHSLKLERFNLINLACEIGYFVDATSLSVIGVNNHTARYLRDINGIYHNSINFLLAKHGNDMFVYQTQYLRMTKKDLTIFASLIHSQIKQDVIFITDNRHDFCINASKRYTMQIERVFSQIKKPIYTVLKTKQDWKDRKLVTSVSIDELKEMYCERFKQLNIHPLNF